MSRELSVFLSIYGKGDYGLPGFAEGEEEEVWGGSQTLKAWESA